MEHEQLRLELDLVLRQIANLQRFIRLCRRLLRSAVKTETRTRAITEIDRAKAEIEDLQVVRDRLRDEAENLDF